MFYGSFIAALAMAQHLVQKRRLEDEEYDRYCENQRELNRIRRTLGEDADPIKTKSEYFKEQWEKEERERRHSEIISKMSSIQSDIQSLRRYGR